MSTQLTMSSRLVLDALVRSPKKFGRGGLSLYELLQLTNLSVDEAIRSLRMLSAANMIESALVDDNHKINRRLFYLTKLAIAS